MFLSCFLSNNNKNNHTGTEKRCYVTKSVPCNVIAFHHRFAGTKFRLSKYFIELQNLLNMPAGLFLPHEKLKYISPYSSLLSQSTPKLRDIFLMSEKKWNFCIKRSAIQNQNHKVIKCYFQHIHFSRCSHIP